MGFCAILLAIPLSLIASSFTQTLPADASGSSVQLPGDSVFHVDQSPARVGEGPWDRTDQADVRLIAAPGGGHATIQAGLEFRLKDTWKIYWRSPGDAGYPPSVDWTGSTNLDTVETAWPVPHRFDVFGLQTAGYKHHVVLPLTLHTVDATADLGLRGRVDYLICSDICIPGHATVSLDLPAGVAEKDSPPADTGPLHLINQFRSKVPGADTGLRLEQAVIEQTEYDTRLAIRVEAMPPLSSKVDLFVEGTIADQGREILSGKPAVIGQADGRSALIRVPLQAAYQPGMALTLTIADDTIRGLETVVTPRPGALDSHESSTVPTLAPLSFTMIGIALIGGFILNLMPCVLPVLSLKVFAFVGHGGGDRGRARCAFLATAGGIIAVFIALGGTLAALRAAGVSVGWGIQFQQPWFLVAMIVILLVFAANMAGLFDIRLPGRLSDAAQADHGSGVWGHALTGAFATVLATPCSAPFLGTAVGFALVGSVGTILLMFTALGLGMAAPYVLIAAVPSLATRLPRPGRWMVILKKCLSLALIGTALWLASVLYSHLSGPSAAPTGEPAPASNKTIPWHPFNPEDGPTQPIITRAVNAGKVVFVTVTADWCITCKVNKITVIDRPSVATVLADPSVVALRADWTRPNDHIAAFLATYGRYGIPFDIVYGPAAPRGIPLPEFLSQDAVLDAVRAARGTSSLSHKETPL